MTEIMDINRNNYETFFLLYLDRELNTKEQVAVENFLNENADLQKEFRLLQNTILWPSEFVFEQKETLYRKEEKRRVIPVYWIRIAAVITLILAGSWFMMTILKNPKTDISGKKGTVAHVDLKKNQETPAAEKLNPLTQPEAIVNKPDQNSTGDIPSNPGQRDQSSQDALGKKSPEKLNYLVQGQKQNPPGKEVNRTDNQQNRLTASRNPQNPEAGKGIIDLAPEESLIAMQKSTADIELQTAGERNGLVNPGAAQAPGTVKTPTLLVSVTSRSSTAENENYAEPDLQTDNAISVVALNDRNKAIAGFFKKLTKRAPADETASNSKKLRVSVFQFSY